MRTLGPIQQKILILLLGGAALGLCGSPNQCFRVLRSMNKHWKRVNQQNFNRSVRVLYREKLVREICKPDGSYTLVLTQEGKRKAHIQRIFGDAISLKKPERWDKKWRIVIFDIPETDRMFRTILRDHLKKLRFHKLQQSVFVLPYPCEREIKQLADLYKADRYIHIITAIHIDNEENLKKIFFKNHRPKR